MRQTLMGLAAATLLAGAAAADTALLIGTVRVGEDTVAPGAGQVPIGAETWEDLNFDVITARNPTAGQIRSAVRQLMAAEEEGRILIAVAGPMVHSDSGTWILGSDGGRTDLANVGVRGFPVDILMEIAADAAPRAIVVLGTNPDAELNLGRYLTAGIGDLVPPQGVTVATGVTIDAGRAVQTHLPVRGASIATLFEDSALQVIGQAPDRGAFLGGQQGGQQGPGAEVEFWRAVQELDTVAAYRNYVDRYPQGQFVGAAQQRIGALTRPSPEERARAAEEALGLDRDQRRRLQRQLSVVGFDPRGIDGIFGPATRRAITQWQESRDLNATGYFTENQVTALGRQAEQRIAELEAEAERQRQERERADRQFWQETGAAGTVAGLNRYLERYPDGLFAEDAERQLEQYREQARQQVTAEERGWWERAQDRDDVAGYQGYLNRYPDGAFADLAQRRIAALQGNQGGQQPQPVSAAQQAEASLNLDQGTLRLIERRLESLGLNPGPVDGQFTEETRRALRRFQQARSLQVTGYVDRPTAVRLLAEGIRVIVQ